MQPDRLRYVLPKTPSVNSLDCRNADPKPGSDGTLRFNTVQCANFDDRLGSKFGATRPPHVLRVRDHFEVINVDARANAAKVIEFKAVRHWAVDGLPGGEVCGPGPLIDFGLAVPRVVKTALPNVARGDVSAILRNPERASVAGTGRACHASRGAFKDQCSAVWTGFGTIVERHLVASLQAMRGALCRGRLPLAARLLLFAIIPNPLDVPMFSADRPLTLRERNKLAAKTQWTWRDLDAA